MHDGAMGLYYCDGNADEPILIHDGALVGGGGIVATPLGEGKVFCGERTADFVAEVPPGIMARPVEEILLFMQGDVLGGNCRPAREWEAITTISIVKPAGWRGISVETPITYRDFMARIRESACQYPDGTLRLARAGRRLQVT